MKDLLFLNLRFPYPPNRGDRIRTYHFLRGLADRYRIHLVTFYERPEELIGVSALQEYCATVHHVPYDKNAGKRKAALGFFGGDPLQNRLWHSDEMATTIRRVMDEVKPDAMQVEFFRMAQYVQDARVPKLLDLCDAMAMNLNRRRAFETNPLNKWLIGVEESRTRTFETKIAAKFDRVTVVSPFDRDALQKASPNLNAEVVTNGVDLDYFTPSGDAKPKDDPPTILFTGTMDYFPNTDAAYYLAESVLPKIREERDDARLIVVGTNPPKRLQKLHGKNGVYITGAVEDVRPFFEVADVFVSPMRCGSGLQNKNLEAMAMGVPVITTPTGAQGLKAVPGEDYIRDDHPGMIAHYVFRLLEDSNYRQTLTKAGRAYVEREHNWGVVTKQLGDLLDGMTESTA
ncbi:MAG: TIGR03087 family PEP-CTERM/XrtA system glycosyltransferase [Candidatus Poribacteria bacterium]|nr:TIGR03087 family PEP-CTERM/XrtA system glycosyltransferase [Candidatus Poribacteria bacterium]